MRALRRPSKINFMAALPLCAALFLVVSGINHKLQSASLASVSVTSSNPRPSFRGSVTSVSGSSIVINTTSYASFSTEQLVEGDEISVGTGGTLLDYTVAGTDDGADTIFTTAAVTGSAADDIISTQSADLSVRFTTVSAIEDGTFRVLVPATSNTAASEDGIPDSGAFDFGAGGSAATVTCPTDTVGVYEFGAGVATPHDVEINSIWYHSFECPYTGSGAVSTDFSSNPMVIEGLINPAPDTGHDTGTADTYAVIVQQLNDADLVQDFTTTQIAVIEAVKVTASVPPQITFEIAGLPATTVACGVATDVTTTAASVPFGEVSISAFTNAAQELLVSTNASGGYVVTAIENDQLGRDGQPCPVPSADCIPDSPGDNTVMTPTNTDEWTATTTNGFAYSMSDATGATPAFTYTSTSGGCTGTYCARQYADQEATDAPVSIFSNTTVAEADSVYVCYRITVSAIQAAGNYENYVVYNATATF